MIAFLATFVTLASLGAYTWSVAAQPTSLPYKRAVRGGEQLWANAQIYPTSFDNVTWDAENWLLTSTLLDQQGHYQARGSIANGYIGINLASAGPFFEIDVPVDGDVISGWPLFSRRQTFCTVAGFWDEQPTTNGTNFGWLNQVGGESVISGIPHWSGLILELTDGQYLDATVDNNTLSNYQTTYDYKQGTLSWSYTWAPNASETTFAVTFTAFTNKLDINQGVVQMSLTPSADGNASVTNILEGYAAVRTDFVSSGQDGSAIYSAVRPNGIDNVTAYVYAIMDAGTSVNMSNASLISDKPFILGNASTIAQTAAFSFKAGQNITITKYVGIASTDSFADPQTQAKQACTTAHERGFDALLSDHVAEWAAVMPDDSVDSFSLDDGSLPDDPYIIESSIMAVVSPYYLLQNTVGANALARAGNTTVNEYSISVGGLSSDSYAGLVFWDADVWMQPGLVAAFPESARRITNYRVARYGQAKANVKTAYTSSKNATYFSDDAALYSWTSGRYGNCTGTGPCFDYEYHLNGDIGLSLINQYIASGDQQSFENKYFPVYNSVATAFADLLQLNGSAWTLTNMTDPDEYENNADAGGFTMPLIAQTLTYANMFRQQLGMAQNDTWNSMASNMQILRENDITLEYTDMNNSIIVKQADVVLDTYPLDYNRNYAASSALTDLDYYAAKQSPNGPGMTYAIFSIIANEISESGCAAYTYEQYSYQPYVRGPFFQFSEQIVDDFSKNGGTHPAFPFLTGHGGANQVVIFGFLGLRYLPGADVLHVDPSLPIQIPQVRYRTFYWNGWPITASSNFTTTTIARATNIAPLSTANWVYNSSSITVEVGSGNNSATYQLPADGSPVYISNRQVSNVQTVTGNMVQCQPVASTESFVPGQFPISVVDGAASTKWQPQYANNVSSVTVTLPDGAQSVSGFYFDWAQAPPTNATVTFHNDSAATATSNQDTIMSISVNISDPWSPQSAKNVVVGLQTGNTTNFTLPQPVDAPKYATLWIYGNQGLGQVDIDNKNGTGATVAEWAIISS